MKVLLFNKRTEFNEHIKPHVGNKELFLKSFDKKVEKGSHVEQHPVVKRNSMYLRWTIRKLETEILKLKERKRGKAMKAHRKLACILRR